MMLKIELSFRRGSGTKPVDLVDIVVNRTDVPMWWRRGRPWAEAHIPCPMPSNASTGLYLGVQELQRLITTNRSQLNWVEEDELVGEL